MVSVPILLMRDARLRVSKVAALTSGDVRRMPGGSVQVRVGGAGEMEYREVSADTMRLLLSIRHGTGDAELVLGMRRNQIAIRIGTPQDRRALA